MKKVPTRRSALALFVAVAVAAGGLVAGAPAAAQPPPATGEATGETAAAPAPLAISAVRVTPSPAAPATLVRLAIEVENRGEAIASMVGVRVTLDGKPLPVYDNHLYLAPLPPGETTTLPLYNFWTSETGRPAPADGELTVEVALTEARWVSVAREDGVETWTPGDAVPGLPVAARTSLRLSKPD